MGVKFNAPPGWPEPPAGWEPHAGWTPDPSWPPPPPGWQFWTAVDLAPSAALSPSGTSLDVAPDPAYGASGVMGTLVRQGWQQTPTSATRHVGAEPVKAGVTRVGLVGWCALALTALLGLLSGGLSGAALMAGLYAAAVAAVGLARGHVAWAHLGSRAAGGGVLVAALVTMGVGAAATPSAPVTASSPAVSATTLVAPSPSRDDVAAPAPPTTSVSTAVSSTTSAVLGLPGTALATLAALTVKGRSAQTGYSRAAFGAAWTDTDRNGCDQRNDILRHDLTKVTLKAGTHGCVVMTGTLLDPYTGATIAFARSSATTSPVQIDHLVPLADAWVTGAAQWPTSKRVLFANDPLNLAAVGAAVNEQKGSGDAATWLPPLKSGRCAYAARQVAVKSAYGLSVTAAEKTALAGLLGRCPALALPTARIAPLGGWPTDQPPIGATQQPAPEPVAPQPTAAKTTAPRIAQGVHPGAFCSPQGALGYTTKGTLMQCTMKPGDIRARWRSA